MFRLKLLLCFSISLAACGSIQTRTPPAEPAALGSAESGALRALVERLGGRLYSGQSAFWLLDRADFSFHARLALVDRAAESLDIQYFIWEKDPTSRLFSERVYLAAERGVRVRILLDDLTLNGQDGEFLALASHPNISVRSFNPWRSRTNFGRVGEYFTNFGRLNHRMHNKTVIADGHFAILGGRNIGDRYFGAWADFVQNDLDIMAAGSSAADVARSFDDYWNSSLSYSLADLAKRKAREQQLGPMLEFYRSVYLDEAEKLQEFPLEPDDWNTFFDQLVNEASPGFGTLWQDLPEVEEALPDQMYDPILEMIESAEETLLLSTAYLVPDQAYVDALERLVDRGVKVTVLTNSLASNNHMVAHMAFKRWRRTLLRIGVELYEARSDSAFISEYSVPQIEPAYLGLHSKAIVVDGRYSFIGSPNIDPRSLIINTEIGFFVDSVPLADRLTALIERDISPDAAWHVYFDERGRLRWSSSAGVIRNQPALGVMQRVAAFFINLLPLKSQA